MPCRESSRVPVNGTASVSHHAHKLLYSNRGRWLAHVNVPHPPSKIWTYCPGHAVKRNDFVWNKFLFKPREMTEKIETSGKKQPWQVVCVLKNLKCWGPLHTNYEHKAKDITPSIDWRREAWTEEVLDDLPSKDERGPSSTRRALEMFQTYRLGNFWETVWSAYRLFRARVYQLQLNCTERTLKKSK